MSRAFITMSVLVALCFTTFAGCADEPPLPAYRGDGVCFPVAMRADPVGRYLFVAGANFDRAFRAGVVRVFDTATNTYLPKSIEIGSFASSLVVQARVSKDGKPAHRVLVASRDDDAVTTIDVTRAGAGLPTLGCNGSAKGTCPQKCADAARFGGDGEEDLDIGDDPIEMSLAADPLGVGDLLHVVGTANGKVAVVRMEDLDDGAIKVTAIDATNHLPGISDAVTSPLTGRTYISNSRSSLLANYSVLAASSNASKTAQSADTSVAASYEIKTHASIALPSAGGGEYGRAMALSSDASRLYLAYRNPNALVIVDIAPGLTGEPANKLLAVVGLGGSPARVAVAPTGPKGRDLVYVSCFGSDDIWIVDPTLRAVRGVVRLPHSPYTLAVVADSAGQYALYASLFSRHTLVRVPLVAGLPPAGDAANWLELFATQDCGADDAPVEAVPCD
jgi:hypothetical protein